MSELDVRYGGQVIHTAPSGSRVYYMDPRGDLVAVVVPAEGEPYFVRPDGSTELIDKGAADV